MKPHPCPYCGMDCYCKTAECIHCDDLGTDDDDNEDQEDEQQ